VRPPRCAARRQKLQITPRAARRPHAQEGRCGRSSGRCQSGGGFGLVSGCGRRCRRLAPRAEISSNDSQCLAARPVTAVRRGRWTGQRRQALRASAERVGDSAARVVLRSRVGASAARVGRPGGTPQHRRQTATVMATADNQLGRPPDHRHRDGSTPHRRHRRRMYRRLGKTDDE